MIEYGRCAECSSAFETVRGPGRPRIRCTAIECQRRAVARRVREHRARKKFAA